jgi:predicted RecA/RadA family phage recombinase
MASFVSGKPLMVNYDPGATVINAGDVVVVGNLPCVAHEAIPAFTGAKTLDALAVQGGIYDVTAAASYSPGTYVHWDPTAVKVTAIPAGGTVPFGVVVGGAANALSDAAGTAVAVLHAPFFDYGGGNQPLTLTSLTGAADAISPTVNGTYVINKAGVDAMTLAAPTATTDDGVVITITSNTANAHTLTATGLFQDGAATVNVATFAAHPGAGLQLMAYQAKWNVLSANAITFS